MEGEGGYFRRNHLVPVPQVASWEDLNVLLLEASKQDEQRMIEERTQTVGAGMHREREHLRTLAEEGFDLSAVAIRDGFPWWQRAKIKTKTYHRVHGERRESTQKLR